MDLFIGTSGYSYKEWKGSFYPEDLPASKMLSWYGERFNAVEINNTFYRMPQPALLEQWAAQVPAGFSFVLKAPRRITHQKPLLDKEYDVTYFLDTASTLGPRLGPLLFQLPPYARKNIDLLRSFLGLIPRPTLAAFEFRHESWLDDEVEAALADAGAALCIADTDEDDESIFDRPATASWGYLRLRRTEYDEDRIQRWVDWVRRQSWDRAWIFFKHEDEGTGPALAKQFRERFGA